MSKLLAVSPLGFTTPHKDMVGAYAISEVTDRAMVSVTARKNCGAAVTTILTKKNGISFEDNRVIIMYLNTL